MSTPKAPSINLLKIQQKSIIEKFIDWALSVGRVVVIFTEIIALSAFVYRFSLDRQLVDLHDKILQKQSIVNLLKKNEETYRNIQDRLTLSSKLDQSSSKTLSLLTDITRFASSDFTFNTLLIANNSAKIEGNAQSVTALSQFINSLKEYPKIKSVSVDRIENKTSSSKIVVGISIRLK